MKHERATAPSFRAELRDLDALVRAEFELLSNRGARAPRSESQAQPRPEAATGAKRRPAQPLKVAELRTPGGGRRERTGEEYDGLFDAPPDGEGAPKPDNEAPAACLLTAEERAFVTRALTFLSGREHADMILGQLWDQLTEEHPDGFYDPAEAEAGTPAESSEARAPATATESKVADPSEVPKGSGS